MKMELIQPFINAADAVLAETLQCNTKIADVNMDEQVYRRKGTAVLITIQGDIEGRVILDLDNSTAVAIAGALTGAPVAEGASGEPVWEVVAGYLRGRGMLRPPQLTRPRVIGVAGNPGAAAN